MAAMTWNEIAASAKAKVHQAGKDLSGARDWLRSDWPDGHGPVDHDARHEAERLIREAKALVEKAKSALDRSAGRVTTLPYPHARNDCGMCRERDADVEVVSENVEGKRPAMLCQHCLGRLLAMLVLQRAGDQLSEPSTYTLAVAPGRQLD